MNTSLSRACLLAAGIAHAVAFAGVKLNGAGVTYATIQAAVTAASAGDRLHVSTGAYVETIIISNKNITIEGKYSAADYTTKVAGGTTVVNGGALGSVFTLLPPAQTRFVDLSITNGRASWGGGVHMEVATTATFVSCTIARNYATSFGGGVYADTLSYLVLTNTPVQYNNAATKGGGMRCRGLCILDGSNAQVTRNFAPEGGGIAMYSGSMRLQNNADVFDNFAVTRGGGLLVEDADVLITGIGTVLGVNPEKNWVTNGSGGGICAFNSTIVISNQARLQNNFASGAGGGAYLSNCTFRAVDLANIGGPLNTLSNYAMGNGGALYAMDSVINISTSTVCMGYAGGNGGGIYALRSTVTLANGAQLGLPAGAWRNYAGGDGAGLYASASRVLLRNAAVQNNLAGGDCGGIFLDSAARLIVSNSSFIANRATPGDPGAAGGAIYTVDGESYAELYAVQMLSNVVDDFGGAIYWDSASNLLINGASVINDNHAGVDGGAIYKDNAVRPHSTLQLDAVRMYRNSCSNDGGAIYMYDGRLRCTDCDVRFNVADKDGDGTGNGGGIYLGSSVTADYAAVTAGTGYLGANWAAQGGGVFLHNNAMLTLQSPTNVVLQLASNRALAGAGGAAYMHNGARLDVQGDVWLSSNNATDDGGAIYASNQVTVSCVASNGYQPLLGANRAGKSGGAICARGPNAVVLLRDAQVGWGLTAGNLALDCGGGIALYSNAVLTAVNAMFANNLASNDGGGVFCNGSSLTVAGAFTAPLLLPPCGFRNNTAGSTGGALAMVAGNGSVADCLIVSNHARYTGGIALAGATFDLLNTVVVQNDGSSAGGCSVLWSTLCARHCTIANNVSNGVDTGSGMFIGAAYLTNCIVWGNVGAQLSGTGTKGVYYSDVQGGSAGAGNLDANPLFAGPAVFNYQLTAPSPCINTGIFINVTNDCIGMPRPVGAGVDLGAYEFVPEPAAGFLLIFTIYNLQFTISRRRVL